MKGFVSDDTSDDGDTESDVDILNENSEFETGNTDTGDTESDYHNGESDHTGKGAKKGRSDVRTRIRKGVTDPSSDNVENVSSGNQGTETKGEGKKGSKEKNKNNVKKKRINSQLDKKLGFPIISGFVTSSKQIGITNLEVSKGCFENGERDRSERGRTEKDGNDENRQVLENGVLIHNHPYVEYRNSSQSQHVNQSTWHTETHIQNGNTTKDPPPVTTKDSSPELTSESDASKKKQLYLTSILSITPIHHREIVEISRDEKRALQNELFEEMGLGDSGKKCLRDVLEHGFCNDFVISQTVGVQKLEVREQDVKQVLTRDLEQDLKQDVKHDVKQGLKQDIKQDLEPDLSHKEAKTNPQSKSVYELEAQNPLLVKIYQMVTDQKQKSKQYYMNTVRCYWEYEIGISEANSDLNNEKGLKEKDHKNSKKTKHNARKSKDKTSLKKLRFLSDSTSENQSDSEDNLDSESEESIPKNQSKSSKVRKGKGKTGKGKGNKTHIEFEKRMRKLEEEDELDEYESLTPEEKREWHVKKDELEFERLWKNKLRGGGWYTYICNGGNGTNLRNQATLGKIQIQDFHVGCGKVSIAAEKVNGERVAGDKSSGTAEIRLEYVSKTEFENRKIIADFIFKQLRMKIENLKGERLKDKITQWAKGNEFTSDQWVELNGKWGNVCVSSNDERLEVAFLKFVWLFVVRQATIAEMTQNVCTSLIHENVHNKEVANFQLPKLFKNQRQIEQYLQHFFQESVSTERILEAVINVLHYLNIGFGTQLSNTAKYVLEDMIRRSIFGNNRRSITSDNADIANEVVNDVDNVNPNDSPIIFAKSDPCPSIHSSKVHFQWVTEKVSPPQSWRCRRTKPEQNPRFKGGKKGAKGKRKKGKGKKGLNRSRSGTWSIVANEDWRSELTESDSESDTAENATTCRTWIILLVYILIAFSRDFIDDFVCDYFTSTVLIFPVFSSIVLILIVFVRLVLIFRKDS